MLTFAKRVQRGLAGKHKSDRRQSLNSRSIEPQPELTYEQSASAESEKTDPYKTAGQC